MPDVVKKLPQITLVYWLIKITATTLGETGGDLLAQTLNVGYLFSSVFFVGIMLVSLVAQVRSKAFRPALYWGVILTTSTAGTTISDYMNRTLGLGYPTGAAILATLLAISFLVWKRSGYPLDVTSISTFKGEMLFWTAILISNTLGTSFGDYLADSSGLGYSGGALLVSGCLAALVAAHYLTPVSSTLLFWAAFVLTRPLGATVGDFFTKPTANGGLGLGTIGTSAVLLAALVALIVATTRRQRRQADAPVDHMLVEGEFDAVRDEETGARQH